MLIHGKVNFQLCPGGAHQAKSIFSCVPAEPTRQSQFSAVSRRSPQGKVNFQLCPGGAYLVFIVATPEDDAGMMGEPSDLVYDLRLDIAQKVLDVTRNKHWL